MKGVFVAAALAAMAEASGLHRAHQLFHAEKRNAKHNDSEICMPGCTTYTTVITGEPTTLPPTEVPTTKPPKPTTTAPPVVPTPVPEICETPGTYTFPARIVTLTETTTVCAASTTTVPKGTHTLGGVTTVVTTSTTVTCPYATVTTGTDGVVTNVVSTTTTVCPSAGTYTIAPVTKTVVVEQTVVVVPVVTTYCPGTYTAPAVITTVTETSVTVWCPFETPAPQPTKQVEAPKKDEPKEPAKQEPPKQEPPKDVAAPPGKLGGGKVWAITYTPFRDDGTCKSKSEVFDDIRDIKADGFRTLRTYSTDCNTLEHVGAACTEMGMKMIIGVFVGKKGCDNDNPDVAHQIASIKQWGRFDLVEMAVVGNEAGHNDFCTPQELKALIVQVKTILVSAGCNAPVTTTDTTAVWERPDFSSVICAVVDVVAVNAHAYFNAQVRPSEAGPFVKGQLDIVKQICGKDGYVMETGWPNGGQANGLAVPGQSQQYEAIKSIQETMGGSVAFFSWRNDPWKHGWGTCDCEDKWGCRNVFKSLNARGLLN